MKKILLSFLLGLSALSAISQTVWKDTVTLMGFPKDGFVHQLHDTIYNTGSTPLSLTWEKTSDALLPGWSGVGICDNVTCYTYSSTPQSTSIPPNSKITLDVQMKALPTATDGCSYVTVTTTVGSGKIVYKYCSNPTTTKEFDNNNFVNIYPNPVANFINITLNDKKISTINVVNLIGKRIAKFTVDPSTNPEIRIPLDRVADGIYLLQFADYTGKVVGVRRVTKQ